MYSARSATRTCSLGNILRNISTRNALSCRPPPPFCHRPSGIVNNLQPSRFLATKTQQRDQRFSEIGPHHVSHFRTILDAHTEPSAIIDGMQDGGADVESDLESYNNDWMRKYQGHTRLVLKPKSTSQVSQILKYCNDEMLAVVPQGGNTGLVGGSIPVFDEIVISMARMNSIRSFDQLSGVLVVDGGVILEEADNHLAGQNHIFPLDLGAKGSCHIAGTISTNAGGLRLLRYGSLRGTVLGVEAVLPNGTIVNDLLTLQKNNTGYDLKQLFIGAEGTLGIVTAVSILCPRRSKSVTVAFLACPTYEDVLKVFIEAKSQLGEILSAFELMDSQSQHFVDRKTNQSNPLTGESKFYCLVETAGSNVEHDTAKTEAFLEHCMMEEIVSDGVLAQDETQARNLWSRREGITEALSHWGGTYKYDFSLPLECLYQLVNDCRARLGDLDLLSEKDDSYPALDVVGYGHMGDGNLHLNVPVRRYTKEVEAALEPWVYEWVQSHGGSISAEHGLGIAKNRYVGYTRDETMIDLMRQVKNLWDVNGIMNPYKFLPPLSGS